MLNSPHSKTFFVRNPQKQRRMATSNIPCWEALKSSFEAQNQAEEWKLFYTRALDFLKALDINPDEEDQGKRGWQQRKMMSEEDDCQTLQTLFDNNTISAEAHCTPSLALYAIQSVIKEDFQFWHYSNDTLSDLCQMKGFTHLICTHTP